jgi:phosphatidylinositol alpha-1,6-mannosyltransferase
MKTASASRSNLLLMTHEFPPYPGGVARYCASIAAAARRAGHNVTVVAPEHRSQSSADCDVSDVEIVRLPVDVFDIRELGRLQRLVEPVLRRQRWDIVHLADWPMILAVRPPHSEYGRRIASLHGSDIAVLRHSWRARLAGAASRMRGFERYVCNSRFTAGLLERAFPRIPHAAITVAPLGVDARWFAPPSPQALQRLRQRMAGETDGRMVLTVARIDARKGHRQTIAALARLPEPLRRRTRYLCIGYAPDPARAQLLVQAAREADVSMVMTGPLPFDEVHAAYALADVFALTAEPTKDAVEGFGLVLLEAAAAGLPSVVTDVDAIPEVVVAGRTGWVCPRGDIAGLARAFAAALAVDRSGALRSACIERAREFSWDACAASTYGPSTAWNSRAWISGTNN